MTNLISRIIFFTTLTLGSGIAACSPPSSSPIVSPAGGSSIGGVGANAGGSAMSSAGASAGVSSLASGAANGGGSGDSAESIAGASPGGMSGAAAGGQSFGGAAGANAGDSLQGGAAGSSSAGSSAGAAGAGPWRFPSGVTKPRIMIVGDSISAGPGCYKKYLLQHLADNHYSNFQFVGEYSDDCGTVARHSAVSCSTAEQYTRATFTLPNCSVGTTFKGLSGLMTSQKPDLVMLQLGVNDVWGGKSVNAILASYTTLVQQARTANPVVVLAVARIQKIRPNCGTDPTLTNQAQALGTAVPAWAQQLSTVSSPIFTADLWTNSDWSMTETTDCVHPNDVGARKMGLNWYNALKTILASN
ncbi:MAG TPA: GDSL-type esterase/lipase family protein [Polyangiaceae bacterium]|nr:GDSL-type esterase/lipase family protein [Polyangiaceae bacterium]